MAAQVEAAPEKLARRKTIIEHCWGTLHWLLPGGFLVKGLKKVRAEASLAAWAYNQLCPAWNFRRVTHPSTVCHPFVTCTFGYLLAHWPRAR